MLGWLARFTAPSDARLRAWASLPTFRRLLGPVLRTPAEGADTTVWLATARPELLGTGKFWHDRRTRREYLVAKPLAQQDALARELCDRLAGMTHASTG